MKHNRFFHYIAALCLTMLLGMFAIATIIRALNGEVDGGLLFLDAIVFGIWIMLIKKL